MMQAALAALLVLVMSGCAAPPPAAPTGNETTLDDAVNAATDSMVAQTQKMPAFLAKVESDGARLDLRWDSESSWQPRQGVKSVVLEPAHSAAREVSAPVSVSVVAYPMA